MRAAAFAGSFDVELRCFISVVFIRKVVSELSRSCYSSLTCVSFAVSTLHCVGWSSGASQAEHANCGIRVRLGICRGQLAPDDCSNRVRSTSLLLHCPCELYLSRWMGPECACSSLRIPGSKVSVRGMPTDSTFAVPTEKSAMRWKHGLDWRKRLFCYQRAGQRGTDPEPCLVPRRQMVATDRDRFLKQTSRALSSCRGIDNYKEQSFAGSRNDARD